MKINSVLKLVTLVVVFNCVNARSINKTPITQECRDTIRDVYFEGKNSVKLSDWSRIYLEQSLKAKKPDFGLPKWVPDVAERSFHEIDLNKNELIELDEFEKEYLDKIKGYFFTTGNFIEERALFISDGWSKEKINKNTYNCEFFNPMRTYTFSRYVALYPQSHMTIELGYMGPISQGCRNIIQNVYFAGNDSLKLSDWSRIYLEHRKASRAKWVSDEVESHFHEIDLNKNELIELDEFKREYLDRIVGSLFYVGDKLTCECDCCECCPCNEDPKLQGPPGWLSRGSVMQPRHAGELATTKDVGFFLTVFKRSSHMSEF